MKKICAIPKADFKLVTKMSERIYLDVSTVQAENLGKNKYWAAAGVIEEIVKASCWKIFQPSNIPRKAEENTPAHKNASPADKKIQANKKFQPMKILLRRSREKYSKDQQKAKPAPGSRENPAHADYA